MKFKTKDICMIGLGVALYVVLSFAVKIPLIGHIQSDLGYIAFGAFCVMYGPAGAIVGAVGCAIESLIFSGWFPPGWFLGQIFIGVSCGIVFKYTGRFEYDRNVIVARVITAVVSVFIGVGLIKSIVECYLFSIPFGVKFVKSIVAVAADSVPMVIGVLLGEKFKQEMIDRD